MDNLQTYNLIRNDIKKIAYKTLKEETIEKRLLFFVENGSLSVVDLTDYEKISDNSASLNVEEFIKHSERLRGKYVVVAHNHPSDSSSPSHGDFYAYKNTRHLYELNGTFLIEEFIISKNDISSYKVPSENKSPFYSEGSNLVSEKNYENVSIEKINEDIMKKLGNNSDVEKTEEFNISIPENLTINDVEKITLPKLLEGYEFFIFDNRITFSKHFSLKRLYELTYKFDEVFLFGVPNYTERLQQERIENICHALGVIECFSNTQDNKFIALLKNGEI